MTADLLVEFLVGAISQVPLLVAGAVAIVVAIVNRERASLASALVIGASVFMMALTIAFELIWPALGYFDVGQWGFFGVSLVLRVASYLCWAALIAAVLVEREPR